MLCTREPLSEAFILTSTNPQNDKSLFIDLPVQYMKTGKSMNNRLSYCGLVDPRISAYDKDLPVCVNKM